MSSTASGMRSHRKKIVEMLLEKELNVITKVKETDIIDINSVPKTLKEEAVVANAATALRIGPILAKITSRVDTKSDANHQNIAGQAAI